MNYQCPSCSIYLTDKLLKTCPHCHHYFGGNFKPVPKCFKIGDIKDLNLSVDEINKKLKRSKVYTISTRGLILLQDKVDYNLVINSNIYDPISVYCQLHDLHYGFQAPVYYVLNGTHRVIHAFINNVNQIPAKVVYE